MKMLKYLMMIGMAALLMNSCNSPSDISGPYEDTPLVEFQAALTGISVEQYDIAYNFKKVKAGNRINLNADPNTIKLLVTLATDQNLVTKDMPIALKSMTINLNSILKNGTSLFQSDSVNYISFVYNRWKDPEAVKTEYGTDSTESTTEITYSVDKLNKVITLNLLIKITNTIEITEWFPNGQGGTTSFNSTITHPTFYVKTRLILKYGNI